MTVASEILRIQNSKAAIKASIEAKGVTVPSELKLDGYAAKIDQIVIGTDISDADAVEAEVVASKTFYASSGGKKTGTMTDNGTVSTDISAVATEVTIAAGKHSGSGKVKIAATEQAKIIPSNILKNISILGVTGIVEASPPEGWTVRFIDYDGTILKTQIVPNGQNATAPVSPSHSLLTFQNWNRTFTNVQSDIDVGAVYSTTTGHSYLYLTLTAITDTSPVIYLIKADTSTLNIYNDATNALVGTSSASGNINITLALGATGDFRLRIECPGAYGFGNGTYLTSIFANPALSNILTKIHLGNSITTIGVYAFYNQYSLTSVTIPSSVTSLGDCICYNCYSLSSITIPSSVSSTGIGVFQNCYTLSSITIPSSITNLNSQILSGCYLLTSVTIPSSIASVGAYAFAGCSSLKSIAIPSSVTSIGSSAFFACYSLTSITIPSSVTYMGNSVFQNCYLLSSVTIPSSVTSIGNYLFQGCHSLVSIAIPSTITLIGDSAFTDCHSLVSIIIPSSVTSIGNYVFNNCYSLKSVTILSSITTINTLMFYNCYSLTSITIPSSVTSLGGSAFYGCTRLVSVTIPASVTSIGDSAFNNCASLTIIYCNSTTPPTLANVNALSGINANYLIKVSAGSVAAYKAATNWITIASHIVSQ